MLSTRLRSDAPMGEYSVDAAHMEDRVHAMPGFISMKRYVAGDGETITVARFSSEAALDAWRSDPEHLAVQERGRSQYYESYWVHTCRTIRRYGFRRSASQSCSARFRGAARSRLSREIGRCPVTVVRTARWWPQDLPSRGHQAGRG
jgi:heme-degrading monooxygenase HmoA